MNGDFNWIRVRGARTHNLQALNVDIPKNQLVVVTGVSGSGKSSLVFDTLHTEAQRQWIETFSSFARRRLPKLSRPDVDDIFNLAPSIVIDQAPMGRTLRSTVGTATEIFTYLRMLFSRLGEPFMGASFKFSFNHPEGMCPLCKGLGKRIAVNADMLLDPNRSLREGAITHPDFKVGNFLWRELAHTGLFDMEKKISDYTPEERHRLLYAEGIALDKEAAGVAYSRKHEGIAARLERYHRNRAEEETPEEERNAYQRYLVYDDCPDCGGTRLNSAARAVRLNGRSIVELSELELTELDAYLTGIAGPIAAPMVRKMRSLLGHLIETGVGYLSLGRSVATLSGGEGQRIKLARQLDCDLTGLLYVLDEPSVGLHPRDTENLIRILRRLRDKGNTVLVVEHDPDIIHAGDYVIDIGPGAGRAGGRLCFAGTKAELENSSSPTAEALRHRNMHRRERRSWSEAFEIRDACLHNLKHLNVSIPRQVFTCVTGVAGSGKSTLVHQVFAKQHPDAILIDQQQVGRNSRSNPATYIGIFDAVRKEFAAATGLPPGLFSFNSTGGCPACKGQGFQSFEMNFMDDIRVTCPECQGRRYTPEALAPRYQGKSIGDTLEMTATEASGFFQGREIRKKLDLLARVGLDYLHLGQPLSTLSGGECQRLKLALELAKTGSLFILDEPTTGLHATDVDRLMGILDHLVAQGNSVVVIEHNLDVMARADWIIDLGPGGGAAGGDLVVCGTPEQVAAHPASATGRRLAAWLG